VAKAATTLYNVVVALGDECSRVCYH